jgi:hypothetical protein
VERCDPKLDLGTKIGLGKPKNQSSQNVFKTDVCIGLVDMNPTGSNGCRMLQRS